MKKIMKTLTTILITMTMIATFTACTSGNKTDSSSNTKSEAVQTVYPYTFTDSKGDEIVIESEPKKIISIAPSVTELIYALGKGDELLGRTDYCDYPEEVADVESIGSLTDPNIEKIIELQPDIVIASTHFKDDVAKKLQDLGIKIVVLKDSKSIDGSYESINKLGQMLNAQDKAEDVVDSSKKKIEEIKEKVEGAETPKAYYVVGFGKSGDFTATGDTFISEMLSIAGAKNIAQDATGWKYSLEKIIENDPEYIIISKKSGMKDQFMTTDGYKELSAVKNDKVFEIDDDLVNRQGPRIADGVEALAKIIHPDLFK
ncbi:ABC transporter substrate-binding protein [Clostridium vincentii]|uniref:Vitamin B12-binding protein n=1 Tax=Clostridium vincentii TaxID=52704 RepID=A0A2T0BCJ1_9CLOT|nr:ABC transporter substrate-binding protein [Clostridium vincentii]PRR81620.1 Vitamin B12-binding protein precursor [Clostridium vincentii]